MHRNWLLGKLETYKAYPGEEKTIEKFKEFIKSEDQCFERTLLKGHVTGSAWIINPAGDKALLTHHRKLNKWMQLGGHSDGESNTLEVALKEAREESGIEDFRPVTEDIFDLDVHKIPERPGEPVHFHYDVRFLLRAGHEDYKVSEESHDLGWFTRQQMDDELELDFAVIKMVHKWGDL